jgi:enamine deaminase RidA (YjgF/YER057c/UK114 family)
MNPYHKLSELGIVLPGDSGPAGNYTTCVRTGNLLYVSGKTPSPFETRPLKGRLGKEYSADEGYQLAKSACINLLASVHSALTSLEHVARIVEIHGSLCTTEDFEEHAKVLDGASDLLFKVFGEDGLHARSVIGVYSLRNGAPLTVKAIIEIK